MRAGSRALVLVVVLTGGLWAGGEGAGQAGEGLAEGLAPTPEELLRAMVERAEELRYQGVRRSLGDWAPTAHRMRLYRDGAERVRFELLGDGDEPVRIMLRVEGRSWRWSARESEGWRERPGRSGPRGPWRHLDLLLRNYRVELLRREEFLGRPTAVLRVASERAHRPQARLWVDLGTFLNVKLEKTSPSGDRAFGFEFVELSFPDRIEETVFAVPAETQEKPAGRRPGRRGWSQRFATLAELARAVELPVVVPKVVPGGFAETDISLLSRMAVVRIGYSDGLSEISFYQARRDPGAALRHRGEGRPTERTAQPEHSGPGSPMAARGRHRRWPAGFEEVDWQGVTLRVARARGMTFVRRTVSVGEPGVQVRTTVVGEIGEDELKAMSASLVEYQVPAAGSEVSGQPRAE